MTPHYWIDMRSVTRVAVFVIAVGLIITFWIALPAEVKSLALRPQRRGVLSLPAMMFVGWLGGWFLLLFVRAEDLHVITPFNYQALNRVIAVLLIASALGVAGFLSFAFTA